MELRIDIDSVKRGTAGLLSAAGLLICTAPPLDAAVPAKMKTSAARAVEPGATRPGATRTTTGTIAAGISAAGPELVIALSKRAPAAAFAYGRYVWIVIATEDGLSRLPAASIAAGRRFADLEVTRLLGAVALRTRRQAGRRLLASRQGTAWHFTFVDAARDRPQPGVSLARRRSTLDETVVVVPGLRGGSVFRLVDPVVGTTLLVATTADPALAVRAAFRAPAFTVLPTGLGVAVEVRADGVTVEPGDAGLRIRYRRSKTGAGRR
jgi:hypothetical protein